MVDVVPNPEVSARFAELIVASDYLTGHQIRDRIGKAGDTIETTGDEYTFAGQSRRRRESVWAITSVGTASKATPVNPDAPIEHHLAAIYETIEPAVDELRVLNAGGARILLRVVQYIGVKDDSSNGVVIDWNWIRLLHSVGGHVDIDQYVVASV